MPKIIDTVLKVNGVHNTLEFDLVITCILLVIGHFWKCINV